MSVPSLNGWWQELACPLRDASAGGDDSDLEPLAELFADARVVGLGESSHGGSELFTMKHRLIEFLITRLHFSVVAFEASFAGGSVIDGYVHFSKGNLAAALTGQGYTAWDTEEVSALLHWLHDHNADLPAERRVRFWGLDSGYNTNGREHIHRYLSHTAPVQAAAISPIFDRLEQLEARWPFLLDDAAADLGAAHTELRHLEQVLARTNPGDPAAVQATRYLRQMLWWTPRHGGLQPTAARSFAGSLGLGQVGEEGSPSSRRRLRSRSMPGPVDGRSMSTPCASRCVH